MESYSAIKYAVRTYFQKNQSELSELQRNIQQTAKLVLTQPNFELIQSKEKLQSNLKNLLTEHHRVLNDIEKNVQLLDPIHVLKRGFSISMLNGKSIQGVDQVKDGDVIETRLMDGTFRSIIQKNDSHD